LAWILSGGDERRMKCLWGYFFEGVYIDYGRKLGARGFAPRPLYALGIATVTFLQSKKV
jgi:hypothetical protein